MQPNFERLKWESDQKAAQENDVAALRTRLAQAEESEMQANRLCLNLRKDLEKAEADRERLFHANADLAVKLDAARQGGAT